MSFSFRLFIAGIAVLGATSGAWGASPAPGEYETLHGGGTLSISRQEGGALSFHIFTVGGNLHFCDLSGHIKGDKGYAHEDGGSEDSAPQQSPPQTSEPQCVISFKPVANGYSVDPGSDNACRYFCGARAWFEGDYIMPPAGCRPGERESRRANFKSQYDAKDYAHAYETLNAFYRQCGDFLHWMTVDDVRNDLAVTQHHLGRDDACLAILKDNTVGTESGDVNLPPGDQEAFRETAKATWFNLKLCAKGAAKTKAR